MMKYILSILSLLLWSTLSMAQVTSFTIDSSKFNKPLIAFLDSLHEDDQAPRLNYLGALDKMESAARIDSLRNIMREKDKINLVRVKAIISKYGWLGPQKVGFQGSQTLFLVIQHADLTTQEQYLPMIRTAEKNGEILSSNLALLEDRINMRQGKKQRYGSQTFYDKKSDKTYFYPIEDPDRLDERRKSMGLGPIKDYAVLSRIKWDIEAYKKMLPEIEEIAKQRKL